jgi:hypothetical protein
VSAPAASQQQLLGAVPVRFELAVVLPRRGWSAAANRQQDGRLGTSLVRDSSFAVVGPVRSSDRYARDSYSERPRSRRVAVSGARPERIQAL